MDITRQIFLSPQDGSTLMHIAAEAGRPEAALVFMKKGVPLHMSNKVKYQIAILV